VTEDGEPPTASALGAAVLFCDNCGKETLHRVLRLGRPGATGPPKIVTGVARCRECRWTHPFVSTHHPRAEVEVVVSSGPTSRRSRREFEPSELLRVGDRWAGPGPAVRVSKIDRRDGSTVSAAAARDVQTVWAVTEGPQLIRIAVLEGARSTTERLAAEPGLRLGVGDTLRLAGGLVTIVALRARGHTWRRPGDMFPAEEVGVVYGRRMERPPAGRSAWRRERGTESSRASSTSRSARSRSLPGVRRNRTAPRARTAPTGATHRNSSSS